MNFQLIVDFVSGIIQHKPNVPDFGVVVSENMSLLAFLLILLVLIIIGKYALGKKMLGKDKAILAIVPVYGLMKLFHAINLPSWLAIICYIPVVGIIPFAIFSFLVPKSFGLNIGYQLLSILFPFVFFNILGFDSKYEFQYIKGKNVAFKDEFKTVMPEDIEANPLNLTDETAVSDLSAKESMVSRAASAAAEQTRIILEEQERQAEEEARKKAEEELKKKEVKQKPDEFKYDIFSEDKNIGPESASLNIRFDVVDGRFRSAPITEQEQPIDNTEQSQQQF